MRTTLTVQGAILEALDRVKQERQDLSRSHTARILIREALLARGIKLSEVEANST
jgi:metal-responsive CopG/Arc/MetJ family transcriptional regulator